MAHENIECEWSGEETGKIVSFRCEDRHQVGHVFDCDSLLVGEEADLEGDNRMKQGEAEHEAVVDNAAERNRLEEAHNCDGLVQLQELKEFHEHHRALVATPPRVGNGPVGDILHADLAVAARLEDSACLDIPLAQGQKQPGTIPGGKDSSD